MSECIECGGNGFILVCVDDVCHGAGRCMHGDGEVFCEVCGGTGENPYHGDEDWYDNSFTTAVL